MFFSGNRLRALIYAVFLFAGVLFLYFRHQEVNRSGIVTRFDRSVLAVTNPAASLITASKDGVSRVFQRYLFLSGVEKENEALRLDNFELQTRQSFLSEIEKENERLRGLVDLKSRFPLQSLVARVISTSQQPPHQMITLNKGLKDGVAFRDTVVVPEGLVGQIVRVSADYSQVLLITDPSSAVDGRIDLTDVPVGAATTARGLVVGKAKKMELNREYYLSAFEYLSQTTEIPEQAAVVTSGMDGLFPPGLRIGNVVSKKKKKFDIFQQAEIVPAVDFRTLQEVLILKSQSPQTP